MSGFELVAPQVQVGKYGTILDIEVNEVLGQVGILWPKSAKIKDRLLGTHPYDPSTLDAAIATIVRKITPDVERVIATQLRAKGLPY